MPGFPFWFGLRRRRSRLLSAGPDPMETVPRAVRSRLSHLADAVVYAAWRMAVDGQGADALRRELRLSYVDAQVLVEAAHRQRQG